MKNRKQELLRRLQRQNHRNSPREFSYRGLWIPHCYDDCTPERLTWWDDFGFVLNKREVMVCWQHPRMIYHDAIEELAHTEAGKAPEDNWLLDEGKKNYHKVGKSRKKLVSITSRQPSVEYELYFKHWRDVLKRVEDEGIDFKVVPTWKIENHATCVGLDLVVPMEIRGQDDIAICTALARKLILRQTTLEAEFPNYQYGREDWLKEAELRKK